MTAMHLTESDPKVQLALAELQALIRTRYPDASFSIAPGEDPDGIYLTATVDIDDLDDVVDLVIDTLYEVQVRRALPVYLVTAHPLERVAEQLRQRRQHRPPAPLPRIATG